MQATAADGGGSDRAVVVGDAGDDQVALLLAYAGDEDSTSEWVTQGDTSACAS
jgi:hypothetical protein